MRSRTIGGVLGLAIGLAAGSASNALPDDHSWPQDCGWCPAPILEKLGVAQLAKIQSTPGSAIQLTPGNANAAAYLSRMSRFEVCANPQGCNYNIEVTEIEGKCVATLPYCGLCVRKGVSKVTWTLVTSTGKSFTFGSVAKPNDGIVLNHPTSARPGGALLTHFKDKKKDSAVHYTWVRGQHPTWGPVSLPRHGHDAVVSEMKGGSIAGACEVVDPPILNTVN
jgi:hypothetical protein